MRQSSLIAFRVALRAACALSVAATTAAVSVDCGGKLGGTSADGGTASSSSGGSSGSSSGGIPSSGSSGGSSGGINGCSPLPGCQSSTYCPDPNGCGGCSCAGGQWVCSTSPNCVADASPAPVCPSSPPGAGPCAPLGAICPYPAMPGCIANCTCGNAGWSCAVTCTTPPPPSCLGDGGLYGLDLPDAGIGSTGATLAGCFSCMEHTCPAQLMSCNADCMCQQAVLKFFDCVAGGTSTLSCGMTLQGTGGPAAGALLQCSAAPLLGGPGPGCLSECGVASPTVDAGTTD